MLAFALLASTAAVCNAAVEETHIQLRVHKSPSKLYITPMGKQCAYNESIDPAMYPCRDGGVCVRLNETYGVCQLPGSVPTSGSDDSSSDDEDDSTDVAETPSETVDSESDDLQSADVDEEEDDEEGEEESSE